MYSSPSEWFLCNYVMPKRMYGDFYPEDIEPRGLASQYERLVMREPNSNEVPIFHDLRRTFCGYLGEILFSAAINNYLSLHHQEAGFVSRLSNWNEDTSKKYDVVIFQREDPKNKVGIQVKLNKNTKSNLDPIEPVIGLQVGSMNLGMEELISANPPYLGKPKDFIRERFSPDNQYLGLFMNSLFSQVGNILRAKTTQPHRAIIALSGTRSIRR